MVRRALLGVVLGSLLCVGLGAQDVPKARQLIEEALKALQPAPAVLALETPAALDQALATAVPAQVLTLAPGFVDPQPRSLTKAVTLVGVPAPGRMTRALQLPAFTGGLTVGDGVTLRGVEVRHPNPLTDILIVTGKDVTLDQVRVLGDPVKGAKRCISANSNGNLTVTRSYVADCFGTYPGSDTQAVAAWDMGAGLTLDDNYLEGGSETVLIGGADPSSDARRPRNVTITGNTITKNPAWQALPIGVKNTIELKNVVGATITNNDISYSWGGHGQDGFAGVFTVRNQDGRDPGATIQDVTFTGNRIAHAAAALNILGLDTIKETSTGSGRVPVGQVRPSVRMARVKITGNTFTDLDSKVWTGSSKMILVDQAPEDLTLDSNTYGGTPYGSVLYFGGGPPALRLMFTNSAVPRSAYGVFGVGVSAKPHDFTPANPAWVKYTSGGTIAGITEAP